MFRKVLIAVDGSGHSKRAIAYGAQIAVQNEAEVVLFHVMRHLGSDRVPPDLEELGHIEHVRLTEADMLRSVAEAVINDAQDLAGKRGVAKVQTVIQDGDPATRIVEYSKAHEVDLIVIGRRGLGGLAGLLLGSVSQKVSHAAPCACLLPPVA
ncbi:MAG: universal stress protein [Hyphomicrobiaceae bacterium]